MMTGRTVSVGNILWKVLKQPIVQDLKYEDAAEYAIEYLRLIGAALSFEDKVLLGVVMVGELTVFEDSTWCKEANLPKSGFW